MIRAACSLTPVSDLGAAGVLVLRRIYEDGFPAHLRTDFAALAGSPEAGETALALLDAGRPRGFVMLRRLGATGWTFLRYFVVDESGRGRGLGGVMWDAMLAWLQDRGSTLLVFDVEDPAEPGCDPAEISVRSRRVRFYERHGARLLPVRGYRTPHGSSEAAWLPMRLMAAPVPAESTPPGIAEIPAVVEVVYQHRWGLGSGHPRVAATRVSGTSAG